MMSENPPWICKFGHENPASNVTCIECDGSISLPPPSADDAVTLTMSEKVVEVVQEIVLTRYYRNPFWSDPRNPFTDEVTVGAAKKLIELRENFQVKMRQRRIRSKRNLLGGSVSCLGFLFAGLAGGGGSPFSIVCFSLFSLVGVILLCYLCFIVFRSFVTLVPSVPELLTIAQRSRADYELWLGLVAAENAEHYFRILTWHQQEVSIDLRRQQLNALQAQADAAARAANATERLANKVDSVQRDAQQIRNNTGSIRDQIGDPRWGRFGPNDRP